MSDTHRQPPHLRFLDDDELPDTERDPASEIVTIVPPRDAPSTTPTLVSVREGYSARRTLVSAQSQDDPPPSRRTRRGTLRMD